MLIRSERVFNVADAALSGGDAPTAPPPVIEAVDPPSNVQPSEPVDAVDPAPTPAPTRPAWYMKRIAEESAAKQTERTAREAAERRAADAEAMLERLRAQQPAAAQPSPIHPRADDPQARQAEIAREAAKQRLYEDSAEVRNRGMAQFGEAFTQALRVLNMAGATNDDFVADVLAVDKANAHVILERMAREPEKAEYLAAMSSRQRIAELTRMSIATPAADKAPPVTAKGISKAPAPAPRVEPSASNVVDWRVDTASDEDFTRGFHEMMNKRSRRR